MEYFQFIKENGGEISIKINAGEDFYLAIANLDIPYNDNLDTDIQHQTDYQVSRHRTVFEGICPHCQSKYDTSL